MKFDVIIATYNRKESLSVLVNQLLECSKLPENIIIVDSSETINEEIKNLSLVKYIKTNHKNQPYQRYVGFLISISEILVYLDDDMRVLDNQCFNKILDLYGKDNIVGVQPNFRYEHNFFDNKMPKSRTRQFAKKNMLLKSLKYLSGNPRQANGKFWLAGIRGQKPNNRERIEWFSGPIFSAKKNFLYVDYNFSVLDFYEMKLGKAEDAILGFTLSNNGDILYLSEELFAHDDQDDSVYSLDFVSHSMRVAYSRLYLSYEYARLTDTLIITAFLHYNLYIFGRIISLILNQFIDFKSTRFLIIKGYLKGYFKALRDYKRLLIYDNGFNWNKEALSEINLNLRTTKTI